MTKLFILTSLALLPAESDSASAEDSRVAPMLNLNIGYGF